MNNDSYGSYLFCILSSASPNENKMCQFFQNHPSDHDIPGHLCLFCSQFGLKCKLFSNYAENFDNTTQFKLVFKHCICFSA